MNIIYKFQPTAPYSLHDMKISNIEAVGENVRLYFDNGYICMQEDFPQVDGNILLEGVDFDASYIHFLSENGAYGDFNGEKISILEFVKCYKDFSFEIIDETHGYNTVVYSGYLSLPKREPLIDATFSFYYTGNIVYELKDWWYFSDFDECVYLRWY